MENFNFNLGGIVSGYDYRDVIASSAIGVPPVILPLNFDTQLDAVVQMQGKTPACVSHSVVELMKLYWFKQTGKWIDFSPRFLDILSAEADIPLDGGRRTRTVLKVAFSSGCATTATLPNAVDLPVGEYRDKSTISQEAYQEALKYKIPGFINIVNLPQERRKAVYLYGATSTLFSVGQELYTAPNGVSSWGVGDIDPLRIPNPITSGHQMTVKGWQTTFDTVRNEWSKAWANNGENKFDPIAWQPYIHESWAIADIPADVQTFLSNLPSQKDFHYQWLTDMKQGDNNEDVKFAQVALLILGFLKQIPPSELGFYGPKTASAVMAYQQSKGINPTAPANIGPRTRTALNTQFS